MVTQIASQFSDLACTNENARMLVEGLRSGTPVTLTSGQGSQAKSATFTSPVSNLGYGEAYIAIALAAEALRSAGVSGCATPDQWKAALMGGPLSAAGTSSTSTSTSAKASSSSQFPGILTLRSQGQGWGRIAQSTNVKLGQVLSSAQTSLNLGSSGAAGLSPTGRLQGSTSGSTSSDTSTGTTSTTDSTSKASTGDYDPSEKSKGKGKGKGKAKGQQPKSSSDDDTSTSRGSSSSSTPGSSSNR